jgi:FAD binding domain
MPARGPPHVIVERADLLRALADTLPRGTVQYAWFAEQSGRTSGTDQEFLSELAVDADPVLRAAARARAPEQWTGWSAADMWPPAVLQRGNVVPAGDAAHAVLPTTGQGACQSPGGLDRLDGCYPRRLPLGSSH